MWKQLRFCTQSPQIIISQFHLPCLAIISFIRTSQSWTIIVCVQVSLQLTVSQSVGWSVSQSASQPACLGIEPAVGSMTILYLCRFWLLQLYLSWGALSDERISRSFIRLLVNCHCIIYASFQTLTIYKVSFTKFMLFTKPRQSRLWKAEYT
jgi:hypothetical protein